MLENLPEELRVAILRHLDFRCLLGVMVVSRTLRATVLGYLLTVRRLPCGFVVETKEQLATIVALCANLTHIGITSRQSSEDRDMLAVRAVEQLGHLSRIFTDSPRVPLGHMAPLAATSVLLRNPKVLRVISAVTLDHRISGDAKASCLKDLETVTHLVLVGEVLLRTLPHLGHLVELEVRILNPVDQFGGDLRDVFGGGRVPELCRLKMESSDLPPECFAALAESKGFKELRCNNWNPGPETLALHFTSLSSLMLESFGGSHGLLVSFLRAHLPQLRELAVELPMSLCHGLVGVLAPHLELLHLAVILQPLAPADIVSPLEPLQGHDLALDFLATMPALRDVEILAFSPDESDDPPFECVVRLLPDWAHVSAITTLHLTISVEKASLEQVFPLLVSLQTFSLTEPTALPEPLELCLSNPSVRSLFIYTGFKLILGALPNLTELAPSNWEFVLEQELPKLERIEPLLMDNEPGADVYAARFSALFRMAPRFATLSANFSGQIIEILCGLHAFVIFETLATAEVTSYVQETAPILARRRRAAPEEENPVPLPAMVSACLPPKIHRASNIPGFFDSNSPRLSPAALVDGYPEARGIVQYQCYTRKCPFVSPGCPNVFFGI